MARKDPTFSGRDVIRIWLNNLTRKEQAEVVCFFFDVSPAFFSVRTPLPQHIVREILEGVAGLIPIGTAVTTVVKAVERILPTLERS